MTKTCAWLALPIILIALLPGFNGCSEDRVTPPLPGPEEYSIASFPRAPGSHWTYALAETAWGQYQGPSRECMMEISVAGEDTVEGLGPVSTWLLDCDGDLDTLYLTTAADTVEFHPTPGSTIGSAWLTVPLPFPLHEGKMWEATWRRMKVDSMDIVCTPAGGFEALPIWTTWYGVGNVYESMRVDFVPEVGIVHSRRDYVFTLGNEGFHRSLDLVDYDLAGEGLSAFPDR